MTPTEERAVLERAAKVCEDGTGSGEYYARRVRSLPLESKESEAEPVAWGRFDLGEGRMQFSQIEPSYHRQEWQPLYTHPAECPKCAEHQSRADKWQSAYAKEFDIRNGTPCEQIRWQQKFEDLEAKCVELQRKHDRLHEAFEQVVALNTAAESKCAELKAERDAINELCEQRFQEIYALTQRAEAAEALWANWQDERWLTAAGFKEKGK